MITCLPTACISCAPSTPQGVLKRAASPERGDIQTIGRSRFRRGLLSPAPCHDGNQALVVLSLVGPSPGPTTTSHRIPSSMASNRAKFPNGPRSGLASRFGHTPHTTPLSPIDFNRVAPAGVSSVWTPSLSVHRLMLLLFGAKCRIGGSSSLQVHCFRRRRWRSADKLRETRGLRTCWHRAIGVVHGHLARPSPAQAVERRSCTVRDVRAGRAAAAPQDFDSKGGVTRTRLLPFCRLWRSATLAARCWHLGLGGATTDSGSRVAWRDLKREIRRRALATVGKSSPRPGRRSDPADPSSCVFVARLSAPQSRRHGAPTTARATGHTTPKGFMTDRRHSLGRTSSVACQRRQEKGRPCRGSRCA